MGTQRENSKTIANANASKAVVRHNAANWKGHVLGFRGSRAIKTARDVISKSTKYAIGQIGRSVKIISKICSKLLAQLAPSWRLKRTSQVRRRGMQDGLESPITITVDRY